MLAEFGTKSVAHAHTPFLQTPLGMNVLHLSSELQTVPISERVDIDIDIDIFVNCNWVDTRWQ